jgi:hypothetical protein
MTTNVIDLSRRHFLAGTGVAAGGVVMRAPGARAAVTITHTIAFTTPGLQTWVVGAAWNNASNLIFSYGAGGGAAGCGGSKCSPGAGGAFSESVNQSLTSGQTIALYVGKGGISQTGTNTAGNNGGDTWIASSSTATSITDASVICGAKGGQGGQVTGTQASQGGQASLGVALGTGSTKTSGGNGGQFSSSLLNGGGGGGAGSRYGNGANGGHGSESNTYGGMGGGGGSGGGTNGGNGGTGTGYHYSGAGGNNHAGAGGGARVTVTNGSTIGMGSGTAGVNGGGGSGGFCDHTITPLVGNGGNGGNGNEFGVNFGAGGGGAEGGWYCATGGNGGAGGTFGGGGGTADNSPQTGWTPGPGGAGGLILAYTQTITGRSRLIGG